MKNIATVGECMIETNGKPFGGRYAKCRGCELNTEEQEIKVSFVSAKLMI